MAPEDLGWLEQHMRDVTSEGAGKCQVGLAARRNVAALLKGTEARLKCMWSWVQDELNCNLGRVSASLPHRFKEF
jgi:hypothetical protein